MKVKAYVHVLQGAESLLLAPGDEVPEGVEITNPAAIDEDSVEDDKPRRRKAADSE